MGSPFTISTVSGGASSAQRPQLSQATVQRATALSPDNGELH
jgi:hypothetical protein